MVFGSETSAAPRKKKKKSGMMGAARIVPALVQAVVEIMG